ncbi:hypothetical protein [Crocinitomix catalasitica]|uniref:hypothetical protein n=1 Tax=Crocinitomix catalasitica TaxID=184607 RepID=UPI0004860F94|nr:hypothetical protein [Crocinitomix catalasitica]
MKKIIYLIIAITTLSCTSEQTNLPEEFDFGKTENGLYTNDFFNLEIKFNPNWVVQDKQQMNNLIEKGGDLVTGDDQNLKAIVKAAKVNTAYLLTIFKYEAGSVVGFNPSFMVVAENTKSSPGIKNGKDYLFHVKKLLEQTQIEYIFDKEVYEKTIGTSIFHVLEAKTNIMDKTIVQEYITTITNGFSLAYIISYVDEDEKNELYEIIDQIKM